jgi:hypothetical protein
VPINCCAESGHGSSQFSNGGTEISCHYFYAFCSEPILGDGGGINGGRIVAQQVKVEQAMLFQNRDYPILTGYRAIFSQACCSGCSARKTPAFSAQTSVRWNPDWSRPYIHGCIAGNLAGRNLQVYLNFNSYR